MTISKEHNKVTKDNVRNAKKKAVRHPRPDGYPKRPLTAFNIFFRCQRTKLIGQGDDGNDDCLSIDELKEQIVFAAAAGTKSGKKRSHRKTHGKISFGDLGRIIATRWKNIDKKIKELYEAQAKEESNKYRVAVSKFHETMDLRAAHLALLDSTRQSTIDVGAPPAAQVENKKLAFCNEEPYYGPLEYSSQNLLRALSTQAAPQSSLQTMYSGFNPLPLPSIGSNIMLRNKRDSHVSFPNVGHINTNNNINPTKSQLLEQYNIGLLNSILDTGKVPQSNTNFHTNNAAFPSAPNNIPLFTSFVEKQTNQNLLTGFSHEQIPILNQDHSLIWALAKGNNANTNGAKPSSQFSLENRNSSIELRSLPHSILSSTDISPVNKLRGSINCSMSATDQFKNQRCMMQLQEIKRMSDLGSQARNLAQLIRNYSDRR